MNSETPPSRSALLHQLRRDTCDEAAQPGPGAQRSMRWKLPTAILLLLLAAGAWMLTRHLSSPAASIESNRTVTSTPTAVPGTVSSATGLDASGYVVARRTATVSAQTIGMVTEVLFEEGEHVEAGQILARLDGRAATASRDIAVSQLAAARKLAQQYEVQFDQAHREGQRATELATRKLVARQDAEQAIAKAAGLRAQLAAQRSTAEATRAQVEAAHVLLEQTVIRAPFAGVITSKAAQVGEIISPSAAGGFTRTGIATIVDMHSLEIEVDVGEAYISRIVPGMPARIRLNAYPELDLAGKVIAIIPTADRGKATVRARIGLDTSDPRILPDMAARVSFLGTAVPSMPGAVPTPLS